MLDFINRENCENLIMKVDRSCDEHLFYGTAVSFIFLVVYTVLIKTNMAPAAVR